MTENNGGMIYMGQQLAAQMLKGEPLPPNTNPRVAELLEKLRTRQMTVNQVCQEMENDLKEAKPLGEKAFFKEGDEFYKPGEIRSFKIASFLTGGREKEMIKIISHLAKNPLDYPHVSYMFMHTPEEDPK